MNINIDKFLRKFEENYNFLYEADGYVAGYDEALEENYSFFEKHKDFIREFVIYRGDFISSDREAVAFMFTFYDLIDGNDNN